MHTITAYCWTSGKIEFTTPKRRRFVPKGAIALASGPARQLRNLVCAVARHAYDGKTLLVPGVPEAKLMGWDPIDKLIEWQEWAFSNRPGITMQTTANAGKASPQPPQTTA